MSTAWVEALLAGEVPPYVEAVPVRFQESLRAYLLYLRTDRKRATTTLCIHGRSLVHFFDWLTTNAPQATVETISSDHIAHYMEQYQTDGRVQGRKTQREGHKKTVRTTASKTGVLRAFFAWAKLKRRCARNPVEQFRIDWGPREVHPLAEVQVAELVRAWTDPSTHPRTAAIGLLCLTYGLTTTQIATLTLSDIDLEAGTFRGLKVPAPIPGWLRAVLVRYLCWRLEQLAGRPEERFVVTRLTHGKPPNRCFFTQILKPYGVNIRQLRVTALAQTLQHGHLKLLTVFGLTNEGTRRYEDIARLVQNTRKVKSKPNLW